MDFKGYKSASPRLYGWDYEGEACYFITINTFHKTRWLSDIKASNVCLFQEGRVVYANLMRVRNDFSNVEMDEFILMPNHVHLLVWIKRPYSKAKPKTSGGFMGELNPMFHDGLARFIRWLKAKSTFEIRKFNPEFRWQPNYYDRIISGEKALKVARNYIRQNPERWEKYYNSQ